MYDNLVNQAPKEWLNACRHSISITIETFVSVSRKAEPRWSSGSQWFAWRVCQYGTVVQQNTRLRDRRNLVLVKCYFGKTDALANSTPTFVLESIYCMWTETLKTLLNCINEEIYLLQFILNKMFNNKMMANISIRLETSTISETEDLDFESPIHYFSLSPEWRLEKLLQLLVQLYWVFLFSGILFLGKLCYSLTINMLVLSATCSSLYKWKLSLTQGVQLFAWQLNFFFLP